MTIIINIVEKETQSKRLDATGPKMERARTIRRETG